MEEKEGKEGIDELIDSLYGFFKAARRVTKGRRTREKDPFSEMLKMASNNTIKQIYKLIAKDVHPDKGGTKEKMMKLNRLYERIKEIRGIK